MPRNKEEKEQIKAKKELFNINVHEVSFVDRAANGHTFNVFKRLEPQDTNTEGGEENMAERDPEIAAKDDAQAIDKMEQIEKELEIKDVPVKEEETYKQVKAEELTTIEKKDEPVIQTESAKSDDIDILVKMLTDINKKLDEQAVKIEKLEAETPIRKGVEDNDTQERQDDPEDISFTKALEDLTKAVRGEGKDVGVHDLIDITKNYFRDKDIKLSPPMN